LESSLEWQHALKKHILKSEGFLHKKTATGLKKPWKFDNMSEA